MYYYLCLEQVCTSCPVSLDERGNQTLYINGNLPIPCVITNRQQSKPIEWYLNDELFDDSRHNNVTIHHGNYRSTLHISKLSEVFNDSCIHCNVTFNDCYCVSQTLHLLLQGMLFDINVAINVAINPDALLDICICKAGVK